MSSIIFVNVTRLYFLLKKEILIVVLVLPLFTQLAFGQGPIKPMQLMRARLVNERTHQPVVFARIINRDMRSEVISDSLGVFKIYAHINDTLYIRSISYNSVSIPASDSLVWQLRIPEIPLTEEIYDLGIIDIYGWGSYQEFKYKVLHSKIPEDNTKKAVENLRRALSNLPKHPLQEQASISLGSPVTGLYNLFSKEGKSLRRLEKAKERDRIFLLTYQKYNREIVSIITGLKDNLLDQFMMFSRPDEDFLLKASDYEIHENILENYERFKKEVISKEKNKPL
jgi:hypothetical protein